MNSTLERSLEKLERSSSPETERDCMILIEAGESAEQAIGRWRRTNPPAGNYIVIPRKNP